MKHSVIVCVEDSANPNVLKPVSTPFECDDVLLESLDFKGFKIVVLPSNNDKK